MGEVLTDLVICFDSFGMRLEEERCSDAWDMCVCLSS